MARKRNRSSRSRDEPELDLDSPDWIEWGGELYWAVDETSGGTPIGLTLDQFRQAMEEDERAGWARAKRLLRITLTGPDGREPEVSRVVHVGEGLSRDAFRAGVEHGGRSLDLVVLLPRERDAERDRRTRQEGSLLARLAQLDAPFRVPRPLALLPTPSGVALVREFARGLPLDPRAGRMPGIEPWAVVGELAAGVHDLSLDALGEVRGHATRRAHGEAALSELAARLERERDPRVQVALAWLADHLPPDEPSTLVHGDLLGQNILLFPLGPDTRPWLIDWEYALRGDPAYDLAIVTRGVRKPFQLPDGFARLLQAYRESSSREIQPNEVRFHELCLLLTQNLDPDNQRDREQSLHQIEIVLERIARA